MDKLQLLRITLLGLMLLFTTVVAAEPVCDTSCKFTITFPGGGSIEAIEALQFTFGSSGLVDTVGSVTAYVSGEPLNLLAGEALSFAAGGRFDLGDAGNLGYRNLRIVTDGVVQLSPAGTDDTVVFPANSRLNLSAESTLVLSGNVTIEGTLESDGDVVLLLADEPAVSNSDCGAVTTSDNSLTIVTGNFSALDYNDPDISAAILSNCNNADMILSLQLIVPAQPILTGHLSIDQQQVNTANLFIETTETGNPEASEEETEQGGGGAAPVLLYGLFGLILILASPARKQRSLLLSSTVSPD